MSDRSQHCPFLAVRDLHQNQPSSLKVRFSGGFRTGHSSLCGTDLIADGKYGYFNVF